VRRIKLLVFLIMVLAVLLIVAGCSLPGLNLLQTPTQTSITTTPQDYAATPTPTSSPTLVQTPSPTPIVTASPINSSFSIPTGSASAPQVDLPNFASVIKKVRPSVVAINTKVTTQGIFGDFTQEGAGSGWIIDSSGLVVTNNHVVEGATDVTVTLEDGRFFTAEKISTDSVSDLAVIKITAQDLPPALTVGDSTKLSVGDWVVAIGNSLGQGISATKGIVSALGVSVAADQGETLYDLIQTDAAINPGNSGGPLVDMAGEVIGINSIKVSQVGVEGMGYAISSQGAIPIINSLVKDGFVTRPWLGISLYTVDQTAIYQLNLSVDTGVLLTQVLSGGPAGKAGLRRYDVITIFDGKTVATSEDLVKEILNHQIGQAVQVTYWRGGNQNTANITIGQSPAPTP
jgi:serine protease Do